jgi:hypothetical protein
MRRDSPASGRCPQFTEDHEAFRDGPHYDDWEKAGRMPREIFEKPVETNRSLRATGNPRSRNQQETVRDYCSRPRNGLESGGFIWRRTSRR